MSRRFAGEPVWSGSGRAASSVHRLRRRTGMPAQRRTGSLTLGAAVGGGTGLSGFLGYEQPNLFGQAKSGRVRWEFGGGWVDYRGAYWADVAG